MFSSKFYTFSTLHLSSIYFKLLFVYCVKEESKFLFLYVDVQFPSSIFWKKLFFPQWIILESSSNMN